MLRSGGISTLRQRILRGLGANAFGQAVTVTIQLLSLPILLSRWDLSTYGTWLLISALPGYLSIADVGMVTAAGNRMTMAIGQNDTREANRVFHSAIAFTSLVCGGIAIIVLPLIAFAPLPPLANSTDARLAIGALAAGVLVAFAGGLANQLTRATNRNPQGEMTSNLIRLGEWVGQVAGFVLAESFAAVAIVGLIMRVAGTMAAIVYSGRNALGLTWGVRYATRLTIVSLTRPAVGFMLIPLANAFSFQGMTLLVGHFLGPATVAVFNAYRTLARVTVQCTSIFSFALWPEFSRLFVQATPNAIDLLYRRARSIGYGVAATISLALYVLSPFILEVWTHNAIPFNSAPILLMVLYAAAGSASHVPRVLLLATNNHSRLALLTITTAFICLLATAFLGERFWLLGPISAMLVSDVFCAVITSRLAILLLRSHAEKREEQV